MQNIESLIHILQEVPLLICRRDSAELVPDRELKHHLGHGGVIVLDAERAARQFAHQVRLRQWGDELSTPQVREIAGVKHATFSEWISRGLLRYDRTTAPSGNYRWTLPQAWVAGIMGALSRQRALKSQTAAAGRCLGELVGGRTSYAAMQRAVN